jgi:hypothetical protein
MGHLIKEGLAKQQELLSGRDAGTNAVRTKKSQAEQPAWPFWLKLSAGGQLKSYLE